MIAAPEVAIYVRHTPTCKYIGDEYARRCQCRKHLRWFVRGKQHRKAVGTRAWAEAENAKRALEDQLAGRSVVEVVKGKDFAEAVAVFIADKQVQLITRDVLGKYARELQRLRDFCAARHVYTVQEVTREVITGFCATWPAVYPSTYTRAKVRERYRSFFRYCYEAQWLERIPAWPKIPIDEPPTLPLTGEEFDRLLAAIPETLAPDDAASTRALVLLMRWSGLAITDALTLRRDRLVERNGVSRIETKREKTGVAVTVPVPPFVAAELRALPKPGAYFFWSGNGAPKTAANNLAKTRILPRVFAAAGIKREGHMLSHRLRDTFAVDLLQKGIPLEEVSKLLGHESIRTTERHYAKWVKGRQDRLDNLVIGTWGNV